jgi:hypothetical protein
VNVTCWTVTKDLWNAKFNFCRNSSFNVVCKYSNISLANIQISQALILFVNIQISHGRGVYISQTKYPSSWQTVMKIILAVKFLSRWRRTARTEEWKQFQNFLLFLCKDQKKSIAYDQKSKSNNFSTVFNHNQIDLAKTENTIAFVVESDVLVNPVLVLNVESHILFKFSSALKAQCWWVD